MVKREARAGGKRTYEIYDADLTPKQRREMERKLNDSAQHGITVLATNALELGVDIEGLDICLIDQIPPSRADLLQRIGRVGRRSNRPGLVLLGLTAKPHDQHILEDPLAAFRLDLSKALPIPLHLDMLRWRHALAAFQEWMKDLRYGKVQWTVFNKALERYFGFATAPKYQDLKKQFEDSYGTLVDMGDKFWVHKGFRATASQGKIPLREEKREVARIEDIAIFRDAHPEAIYLCHDGRHYRVLHYEFEWKIGQWNHPDSDTVLGKWLSSVKSVQVKLERKAVITRGLWQDDFKQYEIKHLEIGDTCPKKGRLEFGVWDYMRKWDGYEEINLKTKEKRKVSLSEVSQRFKSAIEHGDEFPFLHNLSYRTQGWEWDFGVISLPQNDNKWQLSLSALVGGILEHFLAEAVESTIADTGIQLDLPGHKLRVLDSTPGGNGLSEALLKEERLGTALKGCLQQLSKFKGRGASKRFEKYVLQLCHDKPAHPADEVSNVVRQLHEHWAG